MSRLPWYKTEKIKKTFCECCGEPGIIQYGKYKLALHHINCDPNDNRPTNLMTVCPSCHMIFHNGKRKRLQCSIVGRKQNG